MTTLQNFYNWVKQQSGDYEIGNNCSCPMANFAREVCGLKFPNARTMTVDEAVGPNGYTTAAILRDAAVDFGVAIYYSIRAYPWNFESLQRRIEADYGHML